MPDARARQMLSYTLPSHAQTGLVTGAQGICMERSYDCMQIDEPVCGCDGHTYRNTCEARAAGNDVAHTGAC